MLQPNKPVEGSPILKQKQERATCKMGYSKINLLEVTLEYTRQLYQVF